MSKPPIVRADPRVLRGLWLEHRQKAVASLDQGRRLRASGELGPAFVWAVRAVEIFVRDCLLWPLYYERLNDLGRAYKKSRDLFGPGKSKWNAALRVLMTDYGPLDQPLTDGDEDAWAHWRRAAVGLRSDVVHGVCEPTESEVDWVITYADRFMSWWAQRLAVGDRGPLRGVLREAFEAASRAEIEVRAVEE